MLDLLDRTGGRNTVRNLYRSHTIFPWEVEQAAELGWVEIETRNPKIGRPSVIVLKLSKTSTAKHPPWRFQIPPEISIRHWKFVFAYLIDYSACNARRAYLATYPNARSKAGASASAHRLLKHRDVKAAMAWVRACSDSDFPADEKLHHPASAAEVRKIFCRVHHWRFWQL
ncbi:hypothetical protein ACFQY0_03030 [Haloferula chungangensis]|uniref:Site-specific integrase n=1 Tax=Haloferula chungangensis TaxID=1048331 RepID=A0ABW2L4B3_9BACT